MTEVFTGFTVEDLRQADEEESLLIETNTGEDGKLEAVVYNLPNDILVHRRFIHDAANAGFAEVDNDECLTLSFANGTAMYRTRRQIGQKTHVRCILEAWNPK